MKSARIRRSATTAAPRRPHRGATLPMVPVEVARRTLAVHDVGIDAEAAIESSCFVRAVEGGAWARDLLAGWTAFVAVAPSANELAAALSRVAAGDYPRWDAEEHALFWHGACVKRFTKAAPNEEAILAAFDRALWPSTVPSSTIILPTGEVCSKRQLKYTVRHLNRAVRPHLHFSQAQNGALVRCK